MVNTSVLEQPITRQEKIEFKKQFYPNNASSMKATFVSLIVISAVGLVIALGALVLGYTQVSLGVLLVFFILILPIYYKPIGRVSRFHKRLNASIQAYRFSNANGMKYEIEIKDPVKSGIVFSNTLAKNRSIQDKISGLGVRAFEIANFYFEMGSSNRNGPTSYTYGYMRIELDKNLPHIVLDSTSDDTKFFGVRVSNLGTSFDKSQVLKLEGNFNDYFTLYAPKEYETDALYVFTPDLMARFIDAAHMYNAEIIDNSLYIYSTKPFLLDKPETYVRLFGILDSVGSKALKQTSNYRDARSEGKTLATSSERGLKIAAAVATGIIVIAVVLVNFIPFLTR